MTLSPSLSTTTSESDAATSTLRLILRAEGLAMLVAAVATYGYYDGNWIKFAILLLAPDVFMLGYLAGPRIGAIFYNFAHTTLVPLVIAGFGLYAVSPFLIGIALIWLAHVGMDRAVGYGLKYADDFHHTHLGTPFKGKKA